VNPLILIPARYESSRLPGKPLKLIAGKSLIQRVYENLAQSNIDSYIITDSQKIEDHLLSFNAKVLRVDDETKNGTERIYLAYQRYFSEMETNKKYDFVINVQGDEPLLNKTTILKLLEFHRANSQFDISTIYRENSNHEHFQDPNTVKLVMNDEGACHYFSRSPIPYSAKIWKQHIGIYCYKVEALKKYCNAPSSLLSNLENLEQLKALDLGMKIGAMETKEELIGVDVQEDILRVESYLKSKGLK